MAVLSVYAESVLFRKKSEGFRTVYPLIQKYYQLVVRIFEDSADRLGNMGGRQEQFAVSFMGILDSHMMMLGRAG